MSDTRKKDIIWNVTDDKGKVVTWERAQVAVLMDIRDELKSLNQLLHCPNFTAIPTILRTIRRNTSGLRTQKKPARKKGGAVK